MLSSDRYCSHQQYLSDAKNPHGHCPDHGTGGRARSVWSAPTAEPAYVW